MSPRTQSEEVWIERIGAGDREAFEKLYLAYQRRLFGFLFRTLGESGTAEELVNDVMLEVWKSAGRFRGESKPSTWIFGIAHHLLLNHLRRRKPTSVGLEAAQTAADQADSPERSAIQKGLQAAIRSATERLSIEHREIVELTFHQGYSYEEIAGIVRCPVNTVKTRMFYAKKKLRDVLGGMGMGRNCL